MWFDPARITFQIDAYQYPIQVPNNKFPQKLLAVMTNGISLARRVSEKCSQESQGACPLIAKESEISGFQFCGVTILDFCSQFYLNYLLVSY